MAQNPVSFEPPLEGLLGGLSKPAVAVSIICGLVAYVYLDDLLRPFFGTPNQLSLLWPSAFAGFFYLGIAITMTLAFIFVRLIETTLLTVFGVDIFAPVERATRRPREKPLRHYRL